MDFSGFVGLPWQDRGRGPGGYDCWGLFRVAFEAGTAILLPSYSDHYRTAADRAETAQVFAGEVGDWRLVDGPERPFDAVVMTVARRFHIGLCVSRGLMLHMPFGATSVIEPWARRYRFEGLYRHKGLS